MRFDYLDAKPVLTRAWKHANLILVGCGGTGSWVAPHLARLAAILHSKGKVISLTFIDPDYVEEKNIERQFFCPAEISRAKAIALARRYGAGWGLEIASLVESFSPELVNQKLPPAELEVVVGCTDNAAARKAIAEWLPVSGWERDKQRWWLDAGNEKHSGQVMLGSCNTIEELKTAFQLPDYCTRLPSPALLLPELLAGKGKDESKTTKVSCAELTLQNEQGLSINTVMASILQDYLCQLLLSQNLKRFGTWVDLGAGTMASRYTSPTTLIETLSLPPDFFGIPV